VAGATRRFFCGRAHCTRPAVELLSTQWLPIGNRIFHEFKAMRIALLADVHANREALEACLRHAQAHRVDQYAFLGDLVGYGADPGWVLDVVIDHARRGALVLQGNHDAAVCTRAERSMHEDARAVVSWTQARLAPGQREFLAALPLSLESSGRLYVHANAWKPGEWEYVATSAAARRSLDATACRFTFCGHLHVPALYHQGASGRVAEFTPVAGVGIPLGAHHRWLAVLGAVGQPRDGNPAASYAIHDLARNELTFHRVVFDVEGAVRKIRAAGLPEWLGTRLETGV
jgi:diadenosine tetraphosphatase ApaH/serine/threonine PP2A family protein phosphatase